MPVLQAPFLGSNSSESLQTLLPEGTQGQWKGVKASSSHLRTSWRLCPSIILHSLQVKEEGEESENRKKAVGKEEKKTKITKITANTCATFVIYLHSSDKRKRMKKKKGKVEDRKKTRTELK